MLEASELSDQLAATKQETFDLELIEMEAELLTQGVNDSDLHAELAAKT